MKKDPTITKLLMSSAILLVAYFFFENSTAGPISSMKNAWPFLAFAILAFIRPKTFFFCTAMLNLIAVLYIASAFLLAQAFPPSSALTLDFIDLGFAYGAPVFIIWLVSSLIAHAGYKSISSVTIKPRLLAAIITPAIALAGYYSILLPIAGWFV